MWERRVGERAAIARVGVWVIAVAVVASSTAVAAVRGGPISPESTTVTPAAHGSASSPLMIESIAIVPDTIVQGTSFNATATVSGGQPPYTYSWSSVPNPCNPQNVSTFECTPSNSGQYTINLLVTDSGAPRNSSRGNQPMSVVSSLSLGSININPNPVSENSQFQVSVSVNGGEQPYTYDWTSVPAGCTAGNLSSWPCSLSRTGTFPINVTVHDSTGQHASQQSTITVTSSGNGNGNGNGQNGSGNGNSNGNSSNGLNLSGLGGIFFYALIGGVIIFGLLVALTVGVILIAVILARRLPKIPKHGVVCGSCQATAPPGAKFCPACAAPLTPPKQP